MLGSEQPTNQEMEQSAFRRGDREDRKKVHTESGGVKATGSRRQGAQLRKNFIDLWLLL